MIQPKVILTTEPIIARSFSFGWFKRVYVGTKFPAFSPRLKTAILLHEFAHCNGHHTEFRMLLWPIGLWLAKWQEYQADAYVARCGFGPELYCLLYPESPGGLFHPSNCQRRQKLVHNKFFASSTLRADRTVGVTNLES